MISSEEISAPAEVDRPPVELEEPKGEIDNVRVAVRCRPLTEEEINLGYEICMHIDEVNGQIHILKKRAKNSSNPRLFSYDTVFGMESKQLDIYNETARPIVSSVLEGYNGTIFAYGQTGTGKTFTMEGERSVPEMRGIIPNSFAHIFGHIAKAEGEIQFLVRVSYMEIYNEGVRDLLSKDNKRKLDVKERPDIGVYVKDLSSCVVKTADDMERIMNAGNKNRVVAKTDMNLRSSRSHAIFSITIECSELGADKEQHVRMGKLHMVDLAGSERINKTGATGDRFKEATKINLSLTTLGNVISALVDGKSTYIPYRNSNLTRILQDSLGGNSKTVMIANIGPAVYNLEESITTLRYANRAKNIQNRVKINEDPKDAILREMQLEIGRLKKKLDEGSSSEIEEDGSEPDTPKKKTKIKRKVSDTVATLEAKLEREKQILIEKKDMAEEERSNAMKELGFKELELNKARQEQKDLEDRLADLEGKVIVGGVNLLEKAEKQQKLLEESAKELERRKEKENKLRMKLKKTEAEKLDIEEKYATLQEEADGKTRKLKRVSNMIQVAKEELTEMQAERQRDTQNMMETIRQLNRELGMLNLVISHYIPDEYLQLIEENCDWNDTIGEWHVKGVAFAGNNIKHEELITESNIKDMYEYDPSSIYLTYTQGYTQLSNQQQTPKAKSKSGKSKRRSSPQEKTVEYPVSKGSVQVKKRFA